MRRAATLTVLALAACAPGTTQLAPGYQPPALLAVLPLDNQTTDLDGAGPVRYFFDLRIQDKKGYRTVPLEQVDLGLKALGITDGGQLGSVTPQKLGEALGVDAVVYGDLLTFAYQTTGFLNVRKVEAEFRMVDCRSGRELWRSKGIGANSTTATSGADALRAGARQLGTAMAEKLSASPLNSEIQDMVWNALEFLPRAR